MLDVGDVDVPSSHALIFDLYSASVSVGDMASGGDAYLRLSKSICNKGGVWLRCRCSG